MLQKGVKTKEKVSKVSIGNESVGKKGFFSRATVFSHKRLGPIGWFTFRVFFGPFDPPKKRIISQDRLSPKQGVLHFYNRHWINAGESCQCDVNTIGHMPMFASSYASTSLLHRGACLFLGDAMTTFSFLEIHDTLALAKKGRPPTNGYLIIFNHISSSSEMGPLIDTFLFSMMDIWIWIFPTET